MRITLGLDVGTTSLSAVAFDCERRAVVAQVTLANRGAHTAELPKGLLRAELDLNGLKEQLVDLLRGIAQRLPAEADLRAIGVTGQQHGLALLDGANQPLGPAITWQDQRTQLGLRDGSGTWLEAFVQQAGGTSAFAATGSHPAAGFLGPSLYWALHQGTPLPAAARACLIPDAAVSMLTGLPPVTDSTDGGSSGLLDLTTGDWAWEVIDRLEMPRTLLPPVLPAGQPYGTLLTDVAAACGLPAVPVCVAAGDNQASFAGSMSDPEADLLVNVGTGGQISALVSAYSRADGVETRAFFGGRYLMVGAGLYGGRAYAYLQSLYQAVGEAFFDQTEVRELYDTMNRLASRVPPGSDGLWFAPLFTGTRENPDLRASLTGIGPTNFTPGHLARALLEGIAEGFHEQYEAMLALTGPRSRIVGAGNGLTQNPVLAEIVAHRFGLPLAITASVEAAALGAALLAADGTGELPLHEGMSAIAYDRVIMPAHG